jgi:transcriptional regulator with XRE-family HTH domain
MAETADGDRSIGANLRKARERREWSRETLARKSGVSTPTIARCELYGKVPRLDNLTALAGALDVELAELLGTAAQEPA